MIKLKTAILLLLTIFSVISFSQNPNYGYYHCKRDHSFVYIHADSILFSDFGGSRGVSLFKAKMVNEKWLNFCSIPNQKESYYQILDKFYSENSVVRFSIKRIFDSIEYKKGHCLYGFIDYIDENNVRTSDRTNLCFNGEYFEYICNNKSFNSARLDFDGYNIKSVSMPILKDSTVLYKEFAVPYLFYSNPKDRKRMQYKFTNDGKTFKIKFNWKGKKGWYVYNFEPDYRIEKDWGVAFQNMIESHISDLIGGDAR